MMNASGKKVHAPYRVWFIGFLLLLSLIVAGCTNNAAARGEEMTDPQKLLIPRWFLFSMELDGQSFAIAEDQQRMTLQFEEDGAANGGGGCNDFFTNYEAEIDGAMHFGPIGATKMFCEDTMELETAYFAAMGKVETFRFEDYRLVLASQDDTTKLVFRMPPK
jgi:heat shock protein HslJ